MRLLLLEDDERVARGIVRIAAMLGYETVSTRSFGEARKALEEQPFDVVLADLGLNDGESGLDLLRWVSATIPQTRRVLTSGAVCPDDFGIDPPRQIFLTKPFGRAELGQALEGIVPEAEAHHPNARSGTR